MPASCQRPEHPAKAGCSGPLGPHGAPWGPKGPRGPHESPWGPSGPRGAPGGPDILPWQDVWGSGRMPASCQRPTSCLRQKSVQRPGLTCHWPNLPFVCSQTPTTTTIINIVGGPLSPATGIPTCLSRSSPHFEGEFSRLPKSELSLPQTSRPSSSAILHFMELTAYRDKSNKQITWGAESAPPGTAAPSGTLHRGKRTTWGRKHLEPAPGVDLKFQGWM